MGLISIAYAATPNTFDSFLGRVSLYILNPLIGLFFALAFMYFMWGVFSFIKDQDNEAARETGKKNMIWGIVGMFIMVAVYGIIGIIIGTFGLSVPIPR